MKVYYMAFERCYWDFTNLIFYEDHYTEPSIYNSIIDLLISMDEIPEKIEM